jgi:crotonobetainyl-CoA:carnitine CoA-transferase CaiB-like acyl-CoA transferase
MIEEIDHPLLGRICVPGSPLRFHGTPQARAKASPSIGADNMEVYGELLGRTAEEVEGLRADGVV